MAERKPSDDQAAFGVYPQLKRNRSKQDREAAKNVPVDLARGFVSGVLGAPGDIESLLRIPYDYLRAPTMSELVTGDKTSKTYIPTSEDIEKRIPFKSNTPVSRAATGVGGLAGGFYYGPGSPLKVIGALPSALKHGAEEFAKASVAGAPHVMKPSSKANWLGGPNIHVPESDMWRFKTQPVAGETPAQRIPHHEELLKDPTLNQDQIDRVLYQLEQTKGEAALDKWADTALMGYFKGPLASPEDPVRLFIEKNYANVEAKFAKDQERAAKMAQRAEAELDPRKQANMKRQADTMLVQAKDDRDIAMQNISHLPPEMLREIQLDPKSYIKEERVKAGYPAEGMGITDPSRRWEHQADEAVKVTRAGDIQEALSLQPKIDKALQEQYAVHYKMGQKFGDLLREKGLDEDTIQTLVKSMPRDQKAESVGMLDELQRVDSNYLRLLDQDRSFPKFASQDNPFVAKLNPETKMYSGYMGDLGFEHVMDVLRQDLAAQRLRPEHLNKLSVEQAVKRTQEYNLDLAKKINADRASARSNLPVYKEYPEGYKWVQLNQPGNFAAESQAMGHSVKGYEPSKKHPEWVEGSGDEGSSSYGLGGWEAIKSGRAKVYSLIDSRGAPHTTIEVASGAHPIGYSFKGASKELPETFEYNRDFDEAFPRPTEEQKQAILNRAQDLFKNNSNIERMDAFQMAANEVLGELPAEIRQIKGKGNAKPIADYIPYVQDFVKSGKWTDVRDLPNTDLVKYGNEYKSLGEVEGMFKPRVESAMKYLEEHPALETHRQANKAYNEYRGPIPSPEYSSLDYNRGVTVHPNIPYTYNELKAILKDPASFSGRNDEIYDTLSRNLDRIDELKKHYGELPPVEGMKRGGVVVSNNPDTMMLDLQNKKQSGGSVKNKVKITDNKDAMWLATQDQKFGKGGKVAQIIGEGLEALGITKRGMEGIKQLSPEEKAVLEKWGQKQAQEAERAKKVEKMAKDSASKSPEDSVKPAKASTGKRTATPPDFYRKMAETQGDEAVLRAARAGKHLKPDTSGGYVGAPRTVDSPQALGKMRRDLDQDFIDSVDAVRLADPERLGTWYDRAKSGMAQMTEPYQLPRTLEQHGVYSAGVAPESELTFALKHLNSRVYGDPKMAYRGAGMRTLDRAVAADEPAEMGFKIGEYRDKNNPRLPNTGLFGVNDFRRAQGMGYTDPQGNPWKAGVSDTMHPFMDLETALQVDRANKAATGGRSDWYGPHIQELPWVYGKAQDMYSRGASKTGRYGGDPLEGIKLALQDANKTAIDYAYKHAGSATHEAIPGASTGHVPSMINAPLEERIAYGNTGRWDRPSPEAALSDFPEVGAGNRDVIYSALGHRQLPTIEASGAYLPEGASAYEMQPVKIARPLLDFPTGGEGLIAPETKQLMDFSERFRALNDAQEAFGYNLPNTMGDVGGKTSAVMDTRRMNPNRNLDPATGVPPTADQMGALTSILGDSGYGVAPTSRGATIFPFDANASPKDMAKLLKSKREELQSIYPSEVEASLNSSGYGPGVGKYTPEGFTATEPFSGQATKGLLKEASYLPQSAVQNLSESEFVRQAIKEKMRRDAALPNAREDIQNTRKFFAEADWSKAVELIRKGMSPTAALAALGYSASSMAGEADR